MSTQRQVEANRSNARKSTGPATVAGKARSALNALTSGIYAESLLLPEEKLEDLQNLTAEYYGCYTPVTPAARNALDNLIRAEWFARRFARIDTQILAHEIRTLSRPDPGNTAGQAFELCRVSMQKVQQRITATDNLYHRNLRAFQLLQPEQPVEEPDLSTSQPDEAKPETQQMGSFRQTTPAAPDQPIREPQPLIPKPQPPTETTPAAPEPSPVREPQPLTPKPQPPIFQPPTFQPPTETIPILPDGHPADPQDCPNCRTLGYHSPSCHYDLRRAA